jgi:multicomponent Na+:H+ antiporter subunit D
MVGPTAVLACVSIAIAVAAGPVYRLCERAADQLLDRAGYVQAVLG